MSPRAFHPVMPRLLDLDVGLIDTVGIMGAFQVRSTPLVEFRGVALNPAKRGCIIDSQAAFSQEFFDIAIAQGISKVPPDRPQDDLGGEIAPVAEWSLSHERSPAIWDLGHSALCSRSPGVLATEPRLCSTGRCQPRPRSFSRPLLPIG